MEELRLTFLEEASISDEWFCWWTRWERRLVCSSELHVGVVDYDEEHRENQDFRDIEQMGSLGS
jgi:hypothetical protein